MTNLESFQRTVAKALVVLAMVHVPVLILISWLLGRELWGIAVAAVALSACSHTTAVGTDRTLRLALTEYHLVPESVQASPGLLTIVVHNEGRLTHNLAVSSGGNVIGQTAPVRPGTSAELRLDLAAGEYRMASTLFSDQVLGEYGTLTVG